jgi:two-component system chemotaxis sensor kinase CheA
MDLDRELLDTLREESEEHLGRMETSLLTLEGDPSDAEALGLVFRCAHSLKGNAQTVGFDRLGELAHAAEDLLARFRAGTAAVTPARVTALLAAVDALRRRLALALDGRDAEPLPEDALASLRRAADGDDEAAGRASALGAAGPPSRVPRKTSLRVDVEKLDRLHDLAGEIAVHRARYGALVAEAGTAAAPLDEAFRAADHLYAALQDVVTGLRLVPLGPLFGQHARTVRDLARALGKPARLLTAGDDVELDMAVVEALHDPVTHMVRNAMDHGVEPPEVRRMRGKDPVSTIALRARHEAGTVVIEVSDDGAGICGERLVERARALGRPEPERLSPVELLRLVFEPGFSTAPEVTPLSGRGVGLDAVRRNVEALRGSVDVASREGEATTFTLRIPLTLALLDGLAVRVAEETFILPLAAVVECRPAPPPGPFGLVESRDEPLPFARLRHLFGVRGAQAERECLVVVRHGDSRAGLGVDAVVGSAQVVLKPLGRELSRPAGLAGSALMPSGRVALVLDVPAVLKEAAARAVA